jgi:hypothetical protein
MGGAGGDCSPSVSNTTAVAVAASEIERCLCRAVSGGESAWRSAAFAQPHRRPPGLALVVSLNNFWLLIGSALFGSLTLEFFGISIPVVRVVSEGGGPSDESLHDAADAGAANDSLYPLTLPLAVGPGAISVALTIVAIIRRIRSARTRCYLRARLRLHCS